MDDGRAQPKKVFIPQMSDHAFAFAGVMRGMGIDAEVLPKPDDASMQLGLATCRGRECLPCLLCTGDLLKKCREPGFNFREVAFFMPQTQGACRFGQYNVLQKQILAEWGYPNAHLISPSSANSYTLFGDDPLTLRKRAWQGIVAVDLLTKVLHEHRPYEVEPGSADALFTKCIGTIVTATEKGCGEHLIRAMQEVAGRFERFPVDRSATRPLIGVIGELYLVQNTRANLEIVRAVERGGGEALQGTCSEYLHYVDWKRQSLSRQFGAYKDLVKSWLSDRYQHLWEMRLLEPLETVLRHPIAAPMDESMASVREHYDPLLGTEAVLTMGSAFDVYRHGAAGIINIMPFSCMPGTVVASMAPVLRQKMQGIPWLDIAYDGQEETNIHTRLGAFMHQAQQFHRRVVEKSDRNGHARPVSKRRTRNAGASHDTDRLEDAPPPANDRSRQGSSNGNGSARAEDAGLPGSVHDSSGHPDAKLQFVSPDITIHGTDGQGEPLTGGASPNPSLVADSGHRSRSESGSLRFPSKPSGNGDRGDDAGRPPTTSASVAIGATRPAAPVDSVQDTKDPRLLSAEVASPFTRARVIRGLALFGVLTMAGLVLLFALTDGWQALATIRLLAPGYVAVVFIMAFADVLVGAFRYHIFLRRIKPGVRFGLALRAQFANRFGASLTPSQSGGGPAFLFVFCRGGIPLPQGISLLVVNFMTTLLFFVVSSVLATAMLWNRFSGAAAGYLIQYGFVAFGLMTLLLGIGLIRPQILSGFLSRLGGDPDARRSWLGRGFALAMRNLTEGIDQYHSTCLYFLRHTPLLLIASLLLTVVMYTLKFSMAYFVMRSFGVNADFVTTLSVLALLHFVLYLAPSPGGSGIAELGTGALMAILLPTHLLGVFTVVYRFFLIYLPAAVGAFAIAGVVRNTKRRADGEPATKEMHLALE